MGAIPAEQHLGQWQLVAIEVGFESTDSAGDLGRYGADAATVAVVLKTMPYPGYVHAISHNSLSALATCVFLVQVAGSAVAASSYAAADAITGSKIYLSDAVPFVAGNSLAVEIDSLGTFRDCVVTLLVALNIGG
jgi:hypothetical protein